MMRQGWLIVGALVLIATGGFVLFWNQGSDESPNSASFGFQDWSVRCMAAQGKAGCALTQQLVDKRVGGTVLQLTMTSTPSGGAKLAVIVPLGVSVPDGVTLQIVDLTRKFAYAQCFAGGCVALLDTDDALIAKMKAGGEARIGVVDRQGAPIALPVSLKGFAPAFEKMQSKGGVGGDASWWSSLLNLTGK